MARIWVCFDAHAEDGCVWAVREGNKWHVCKEIDIRTPLVTVYKGREARQPKAYLVGRGSVSGTPERLTIR